MDEMSYCSFSGGEEYKNHFQPGEYQRCRKSQESMVLKLSFHWHIFPLRYVCVFRMWARVIFQHVKVWALFSMASLLTDNPRGQCLQTPWSMGTHQGRFTWTLCLLLLLWSIKFKNHSLNIPGLLWEVWQRIRPWVSVWRTKRGAITLLNIQQLTDVHP